jgi:signal transduction histidine kinase/ActR/RegA family two-component response regulator
MTNAELVDSSIDAQIDPDEIGTGDLRKSVGLVDRLANEDDMLQYFLESEAAREQLERCAEELRKQADEAGRLAREAQTAAQSKGDFLAIMSHEIRTPLNGIIGMTSMLLSRALGQVERDFVETIRSSGEALLGIIDSVLDFSKIEAGSLELENVEFELTRCLETAIQIVEPSAARKSLRLITHVDPAVPTSLQGDIVRLRQVLLNLLSNAIKFSTAGSVYVRVDKVAQNARECVLRFQVIDQGVGISEAQQSRLFRPYSQANQSIAREFGGTGLGLSICKRLVELMGGSISVASAPGKGSTFSFTVKVNLVQATGSEPVLVAPPEAPVELAPTRPFRILVVEDNSINQKVATVMLTKLGYQVDVANNGFEALSALGSLSYDLVLMDCFMPRMDGFEATRRIREAGPALAQIPIIAMTANASQKDKDSCLDAGMTDYLSKPVRQAELKAKLAFWLAGKTPAVHLGASSANV